MRSYSGLLIFENVFDSVTSTDTILSELCTRIFYPSVPIVEDYCNTLLGEEVDVNYEIEGYVELSTGEPLTKSRIEELLYSGTYKVRIRTLSTCVSEGGVCAKCYNSSRQDEPYPEVGSIKTIDPLFVKSTEVILVVSQNEITLSLDSGSYDKVLVYCNGQLLYGEDFYIEGQTLRFNNLEVSPGDYAVVRYISDTKVPYMLWLAGTYSGSLIGVKSLPGPLLPIRSLLLTSLIPEHYVDDLVGHLESDSSRSPGNIVEYLSSIPDLLERALLAIALSVVYDAS